MRMTINLRDKIKEDFQISKNSNVEFFIKIDDYEGWIDATVTQIRGEFYIVEYSTNHKSSTRILNRSEIRPKTTVKETFELSTDSKDVISYKLDYLTGMKNKLGIISNIIDQIKNFVEVNFIFYSKSNEELLIFVENGNDSAKLEFLNEIMNTIREHYVK
jgi:hypothetical protein